MCTDNSITWTIVTTQDYLVHYMPVANGDCQIRFITKMKSKIM